MEERYPVSLSSTITLVNHDMRSYLFSPDSNCGHDKLQTRDLPWKNLTGFLSSKQRVSNLMIQRRFHSRLFNLVGIPFYFLMWWWCRSFGMMCQMKSRSHDYFICVDEDVDHDAYSCIGTRRTKSQMIATWSSASSLVMIVACFLYNHPIITVIILHEDYFLHFIQQTIWYIKSVCQSLFDRKKLSEPKRESAGDAL